MAYATHSMKLMESDKVRAAVNAELRELPNVTAVALKWGLSRSQLFEYMRSGVVVAIPETAQRVIERAKDTQ